MHSDHILKTFPGHDRSYALRRFAALTIAVLCIAAPTFAAAEPLNVGSNVRVHVRPLSLKTLRDQNVVRQALDYSCGAAALATLLTYGLGQPVTEREILQDLFKDLSASEAGSTREQGFSLLDLQRVAQARGLKAQGFFLKPEGLAKLSGPVVVFIQPQGYQHFAVLRGVKDDRVFLADPSLGNIRMPAYQFMQQWLGDKGVGVIFVVEAPSTATAVNQLAVTAKVSQPELMAARELLAVRAALR